MGHLTFVGLAPRLQEDKAVQMHPVAIGENRRSTSLRSGRDDNSYLVTDRSAEEIVILTSSQIDNYLTAVFRSSTGACVTPRKGEVVSRGGRITWGRMP